MTDSPYETGAVKMRVTQNDTGATFPRKHKDVTLSGGMSRDGSVLLITLLVVSLLLMVTLAFTVAVRMEIRSLNVRQDRVQAQNAARLGLQLAIGDLQKFAGPDQRVTATADILPSAAAGNRHWVGVWDTTSVDPFDPAGTRVFQRWLVSSSVPAATDQIGYAGTPVAADGTSGVPLFEALDGHGVPDPEWSVHVPLVGMAPQGGANTSQAYAYWVEDEGVKASILPSPDFSVSGLSGFPYANAAMLGRNRGLDFGQIGGALGAAITYPLISPGNTALLERILRVPLWGDLLHAAGDTEFWLNGNRHDFTLYSHALLTNARDGGLKQDLSLAFEMDGDTQGPNGLNFFNQSDFVGDGTRTETNPTGAIAQAPGHDFFARYVFAHFPYGIGASKNARGPTWHLLRDYYNLYKRLQPSAAGLRLDAQPFYPNLPERTPGTYEFLQARFAVGAEPFVTEFRQENGYFRHHLSRGNHTPILLGYRLIFSIAAFDHDPVTDTAKIAFAFDPVYYLWNPYDKSLRFENYKIEYNEEIPVTITYQINDANGTRNIDEVLLTEYLAANGWDGSSNRLYSFLRDPSGPVTLAPGEVRIFSAANTQGDMFPGVANITPASGNILRTHPVGDIVVEGFSSAEIRINLGVTTKTPGTTAQAGRFMSTSYLIRDADLPAARASSNTNTHRKTQFISIQSNAPDADAVRIDTVQLTHYGNELTNGNKRWLGYLDYLLKPSVFAQEPVEIMTAFNPVSPLSEGDIRVFPQRNRFFHLVSETALNSILPQSLNDLGFWGNSYGAAGRNHIAAFAIPGAPLTSLAQLRHGMLTPYVFEHPRGVGNATANPRLEQDRIYGFKNGPPGSELEMYDSTWLLNDALWDGYFFSGIAPKYRFDGGGYTAEEPLGDAIEAFLNRETDRYLNASLVPLLPDGVTAATRAGELAGGDGYRHIAANLLVQGGFNVNSTSVAAWAALLGGNRDLDVEVFTSRNLSDTTDTEPGVPFPKTQRPNDNTDEPWNGFRRLEPTEIWDDNGTPLDDSDDSGLAVEIVKQVRLRGPFTGLSDFVNRRITEGETGQRGALQAAIDAAGINTSIRSSEGVNTDYSTYFKNPNGGSGNTAGGINGYLEQADLLQIIGPRLGVRSDTFRIRVYGESRDSNGNAVSQATGEAVVQRLPNYLDATDDDWVEPDNASPVNRSFGRQFRIISFQWL